MSKFHEKIARQAAIELFDKYSSGGGWLHLPSGSKENDNLTDEIYISLGNLTAKIKEVLDNYSGEEDI